MAKKLNDEDVVNALKDIFGSHDESSVSSNNLADILERVAKQNERSRRFWHVFRQIAGWLLVAGMAYWTYCLVFN